MLDLSQETILVTGGAGGIGSAVCKFYNKLSARIVILDVNREAGLNLEKELSQSAFICVDVTNESEVSELSHKLPILGFPSITHVVSVAGGAVPGEASRFEDLDFQIVRKSFTLNLESHLSITKALLPLLKNSPSKNKSITVISSVNALRCFQGFPIAAYSSAKAGLLGFVVSTAGELGSMGIRINAILPGTTPTPRTLKQPKNWPALMEKTALKRFTTPEEVGKATFALSHLLTAMTGQTLVLDCGQIIMAP